MRVFKTSQLDNSELFTLKNSIQGLTKFDELERELAELIFYADGEKESVIAAMIEEFHAKPFECIAFDGWYIALLTN